VPRIGLVADGLFDERAIGILLSKCGQGITVVPRQCGGRNFSRAAGILKELERRDLVDLAIWATDSETDDPVQLETRMREAVKKAALHLPVCCVSVVRMIEAWLLADEVAVQSVCGRSRIFNSPEILPNPKAELRRILAQRPYTSAVAESIAEAANVETIAKRCPSFRKLRACLAQTSQHPKSAAKPRISKTKPKMPKGRSRLSSP
jgi:hypothetical protein